MCISIDIKGGTREERVSIALYLKNYLSNMFKIVTGIDTLTRKELATDTHKILTEAGKDKEEIAIMIDEEENIYKENMN